jgi:hypothetical protein
MKKYYLFLAALVMAMGFTLTGCDQASGSVGSGAGAPNPGASGGGGDSPEEPLFTGAVSSVDTSPIAKGAKRQFSVNAKVPVKWEVTGNSEGGGTSISDDGVLTVGKKEASITLVVRAISAEETAKSAGEELGTAEVKLQGWKDLTGKLSSIFADGDPASSGLGAFDGITAAAYGNGRWVIAGHSAEDWWYTAVAWSDDEGETWHEAEIPAIYEEFIFSIAYNGERFVLGDYLSHGFYSPDGAVWTKVLNVVPPILTSKPDLRNPLRNIVYGEVDGGGLFIAANSSSHFSTSTDGVNWTYRGAAEEGNTAALHYAAYGSGLLDGKRVKMFKGWGLGTAVYSVNGVSWTPLTAEAEAALRFVPSVPKSGYDGIGVQAVNTSSGPMFKDPIFTGGKKGSANVSFSGSYVPAPADDGSVSAYILKPARASSVKWDYEKHVKFIVPGGGKYLAVGVGNRAAIAHAEAFK